MSEIKDTTTVAKKPVAKKAVVKKPAVKKVAVKKPAAKKVVAKPVASKISVEDTSQQIVAAVKPSKPAPKKTAPAKVAAPAVAPVVVAPTIAAKKETRVIDPTNRIPRRVTTPPVDDRSHLPAYLRNENLTPLSPGLKEVMARAVKANNELVARVLGMDSVEPGFGRNMRATKL